MPTMKSGDILDHEFMGEVVYVGSGNKKLKVGDKVVVPFTIPVDDAISAINIYFHYVKPL